MVPNGHESTYVFFRCIIQLGLFQPKIGLIRKIDLFLYYWNRNAKKDKNSRWKKRDITFPQNNTQPGTRKH